MIYLINYSLDGIIEPSGAIFENEREAVNFAKQIAEMGLFHLDDLVNFEEWFDADGQAIGADQLLQTCDLGELKDHVDQIGEVLKVERMGHIDSFVYEDLLDLLNDQHVDEWCGNGLKQKIKSFRELHREIRNNLDSLLSD